MFLRSVKRKACLELSLELISECGNFRVAFAKVHAYVVSDDRSDQPPGGKGSEPRFAL
jgi:hypothetical protein